MGIEVYPSFPAIPGNKVIKDSDYVIPTRPFDYGVAVARGLYEDEEVGDRFGRNPDIDTGSTPEDIWNGGGLYTGFNATANEEIAVASSDVNDQGLDVTSGTATGGSANTLEDTGATFITAGVAVGDALVNESKGGHGIISEVTSETVLTVYYMSSIDPNAVITNENLDDYRVVNANDTGAALVRLSFILDEDFEPQLEIYITLNGSTTVTTSGVNAMRCSFGEVILAGSSETNEGTITANQAVSTANVFMVMPAEYGQTAIMATTVPAGVSWLIKTIQAGLVRSNGAAGSGTILLSVRPVGEAWKARKAYEVSNSLGIPGAADIGGVRLNEKTDVKMNVPVVSDNNSVLQGSITILQSAL